MLKIILPKPVIRIERWKYSKLYGIYVSNLGNFRDKEKQPIKPKVNSGGYLVIKTKYGMDLAHRVVATTWMPTEGMLHLTVDHLDHNKRNNAVDNLEWVTKQENERRAAEDFVDERRPVVEISSSMPASPTTTISASSITVVRVFRDSKCTNCLHEFSSTLDAAKWIRGVRKELEAYPIDSTAEKIFKAVTNKTAWCTYYFTAE